MAVLKNKMKYYYNFSCYNNQYRFTENEISYSPILMSLSFSEKDVNLNYLCPFIFKKENKIHWEWIYSELKRKKKGCKIYRYKFLFEALEMITFLNIDFMLYNICFTLNSGLYSLDNIMKKYELIPIKTNIIMIVQLMLIKRFLSLENIIKFIIEIKCSIINITEFIDEIIYLITLFSSNSLIIDDVKQESFFKNINIFLFLSNIKNIKFGKIFETHFDKINSIQKFLDSNNIKTLKNIIPNDYFHDDENDWERSIYGFGTIIIDFNNDNLEILNLFDKNTVIYEFIDPYTNIKYFIFSNSLICDCIYLSFEKDENYPFYSKSKINIERLKPIFIISDLVGKNYFCKDNKIIFTYDNIEKYNNVNNEYVYENIFYTLEI